MNKKFFAALTSAAMLLSSTGVVLANDFVEVETSGAPGAAEQANFLNSTNFPDKKLLSYLEGTTYTLATGGTSSGKLPTDKDEIAKITSLSIPADKGISDLTGLEYFTGLTDLAINTSGNNIEDIDLSANTALKNLAIGPTATITATTPPTLSVTATKSDETLTSVVLPSTITLNNVTIAHCASLDYLDVSVAPALNKLVVNNNGLVTLDASKNVLLGTLTANNNALYEVKVPASVTDLDLDVNKLQSLDASSLKSLTSLKVANNMLESIKLPAATSFATLNINNNHLATLNLKDVTFVSSPSVNVSSQSVYSNPDNTAVNMAEYDENFKASGIANQSGSTTPDTTGGTAKDGIFSFTDGKTLGYLRDTGIGSTPTKTVPSYVWNVENSAVSSNMTVQIVAADLMNRLYNPNSGEHFYTKDVEEKDTLVKLGWQSEGIGWVAPDEDSSKAAAPVFRLYNANAGDHHYTTSANERDVLVTKGWKAEGIGWYSAEAAGATESTGNTTGALASTQLATTGASKAATIEVFREYNPNAKEAGAHNYTISENENDTLVSLGWLDEGIGWWALK